MDRFEIRTYEPADQTAVLHLLGSSLGWLPDDLHVQLFSWKHLESPFGTSPAWVAVVDGEVVGFRTFMRWELLLDGTPVRAVRAVDTATHPDHRGRGIFAGLTAHGLRALRDDGVSFVFNTPNDQSRPGYLKLGWRPVRQVPVRARPRSLPALSRMARARTPADKWSRTTDLGRPAGPAFADAAVIGPAVAVLAGRAARSGLATRSSPAFLRWRYGFEPLAYRAVWLDDGPPGGMLVVRLRRRGAAVEVAVCEELVPDGDARRTKLLIRHVLDATGADYAVRVGDHLPAAGCVRLPRRGPILVTRDLAGTGPVDGAEWHLGLGDLELF
ncbi:MAG: GNAT family N-acetyltransferase [Ilumatobacteraceae bacterium]